MSKLVPATSIYTVELDQDFFRPVIGDKSNFNAWKESLPDQLRHLIRSSLPNPDNSTPYTNYLSSYYPFFSFAGNSDLATSSTRFTPKTKPREIGLLESDETANSMKSLMTSVFSAQNDEGYTSLYVSRGAKRRGG